MSKVFVYIVKKKSKNKCIFQLKEQDLWHQQGPMLKVCRLSLSLELSTGHVPWRHESLRSPSGEGHPRAITGVWQRESSRVGPWLQGALIWVRGRRADVMDVYDDDERHCDAVGRLARDPGHASMKPRSFAPYTPPYISQAIGVWSGEKFRVTVLYGEGTGFNSLTCLRHGYLPYFAIVNARNIG
jgi:hypothetical protein